jgi:zinc protease
MKTSFWKICGVLGIAAQLAAGTCAAETTEFRLDNGLRVTLRPVAGASDVAVVVLYDMGELDDPPGKSGLGHLLEHIYATAATPSTPQRTATQFMENYAKEIFGQHVFQCNAQTGNDFTVLAGVVSPDRMEGELKQAAERMSLLRIEPSDLDREVPRMLREIHNMFEGVPQLALRNHARERLHPRPNGGRHGGVAEHIKQFTLKDVRQHWSNYYQAGNARLLIAGDFDPKTVEEKVRQAFRSVPAGKPLPAKPGEGAPSFGTIKIPAAQKSDGAWVCLAYRYPPPDSKLFPAFVALVACLQENAGKIMAKPMEWPVTFMPMDDFGTVYVMSKTNEGETCDQAVERWSKFVADSVHGKDLISAGPSARDRYFFLLNTKEIPDSLQGNMYGVAFVLGREKQLGIDGRQLGIALDQLEQGAIEQCAKEYFGEDKRVTVVLEP